MKFYVGLVLFCVFLPIIFLIAFTPEKCEHEETIERYAFDSVDSIVENSVTITHYCKKCDKRVGNHSEVNVESVGDSYLGVIVRHSDATEINPGEYYTITATAPFGFVGGMTDKIWLHCDAETEDYIVRFVVDFNEEFRELVSSVNGGDIITFRGRFYDSGCGFSDAELIDIHKNTGGNRR